MRSAEVKGRAEEAARRSNMIAKKAPSMCRPAYRERKASVELVVTGKTGPER